MRPVVLTNARIIDPSQGIDEVGSIIIENGKIIGVGKNAQNQGIPDGAELIDCAGKVAIPGLVDSRVFIGEPGEEYRETIASASDAASVGGVTSLIMMPDTKPIIDDVALVEFILRTANETSSVNIYPSAAITRGFEGKEMSEFGLLKAAGAVALTEGKKTLKNSAVLRQAMTYARDFDMPIMHETQDDELMGHGVMNEGLLASWLGLHGIPREAEVIPLERDLRLATLTGVRYHASQLSTALSLEAIKRAKDNNPSHITAGVSINHLTLNENDIGEYRTFFRMIPPLRAEEDRIAMIEAVRDGIIDVIVSSHDPQQADTKRLPFEDAENGAVGLETLLSAALRNVHNGSLSLSRLVEVLSTNPARIFGLDAGTLKKGAKADVAILDLEFPWILSLDMLHSRSKNTPFENARFQGRVVRTIVNGKTVFCQEDV